MRPSWTSSEFSSRTIHAEAALTFHRYIGVMTLLSVNTTEHERPIYIGMTGLTWGLGTVLGPVSTDDILSSLSALISLAF